MTSFIVIVGILTMVAMSLVLPLKKSQSLKKYKTELSQNQSLLEERCQKNRDLECTDPQVELIRETGSPYTIPGTAAAVGIFRIENAQREVIGYIDTGKSADEWRLKLTIASESKESDSASDKS